MDFNTKLARATIKAHDTYLTIKTLRDRTHDLNTDKFFEIYPVIDEALTKSIEAFELLENLEIKVDGE